VLHLIGAKNDVASGTFIVINPNSSVLNVDPADGPGNIRIDPLDDTATGLVKVGDPAVVIPAGNVTIGILSSLGSGEAQVVRLSVLIPDGIPVNAFYTGSVTVTYEGCSGGDVVSDQLAVQLEVRETQGTLDILENEITDEFCPDDPWLAVGQVELRFDVRGNGDHRNVRVSSGGLEHASLDRKLDDFNFFPAEYALISAGETKTARVIVRIPIGQHAGVYSGYFRVVSESGGEDSVLASIDICPLYDLDIKDHYGNLRDNVMVINATSRSNQSGGEWALRAFDIGLPSELVNNHDEFDGPANAPIDCIVCEFSPWSNAWINQNYHSNFVFTGQGTVQGEPCDWQQGEFKRMYISLFVPPMWGNDNHPGTYRGRLDCWAAAGGNPVAHDFFDIEIELARVVGPGQPHRGFLGVFGAEPAANGALLYWGDFGSLGMSGSVNLYRLDEASGSFTLIQSGLAQNSSYLDQRVDPQPLGMYKLGIAGDGEEFMIGPLTVGGNPAAFRLGQNFPNPFRGETMIPYDLPASGQVSLKIFDITGKLVKTLVDGQELAGFHAATWDGRNHAGRSVASGIYYYRLSGPERQATMKMLVIE